MFCNALDLSRDASRIHRSASYGSQGFWLWFAFPSLVAAIVRRLFRAGISAHAVYFA